MSFDPAAVANLVELALFERLETMSFGVFATMPFAWVNDDFTPPEDGRYIEVKHFPNEPINYAGGGVGILNGFLQVSVHWSRNAGTFEPNAVAGLVVARFPSGLKIPTAEFQLLVYKPPHIAAFVPESSADSTGQNAKTPFVPVTIWYRAETI